LYSSDEFLAQINKHSELIQQLYGQTPRVFRNTELIYSNELAETIEKMDRFDAIITEGADHILGHRNSNFVYRPPNCKRLKLLLKNYSLSDDIAFRFSNPDWKEYPLTADKFAHWVNRANGNGQCINLFMDYETFGEHQWEDTGIFSFMSHLPEEVLKHPDNSFMTPSEVIDTYDAVDVVDVPRVISWADTERDLSAWLGNAMQSNALHEIYKFEDLIKLITNRSFLFIALLCVSFYAAVFPFIQYAPDLMVNKFGFSYNLPEAGNYFKIFDSISLGNALIFIGLFVFGISFSMVPAQMKTTGAKIITLLIIFALFIAFIGSLWGTLSLWLKNGPKTASLIPMGTILFTPIFGSYIDRKGKAASVMILGSLLLIFAHISLSLFNSVILGYLGLLSLGIAFSLVPAAMWPSVAKIVAESRLGTAYATMFTIQNIGLLVFFWGIGKVLDMVNPEVIMKLDSAREMLEGQGLSSAEVSEQISQMRVMGEIPPYNYFWPIFMLVILGVISIFLSLQLKKADAKQKYGLELPFGNIKEE